MANYAIECTVSELAKEGSKIAVKIVGSEGYAIKHGNKTYNIFCPEVMSNKYLHGHIVDPEVEFIMDGDFKNILIQAFMHGKKIRLSIELENGKELKDYIQDKTAIPIQSVSLFQK